MVTFIIGNVISGPIINSFDLRTQSKVRKDVTAKKYTQPKTCPAVAILAAWQKKGIASFVLHHLLVLIFYKHYFSVSHFLLFTLHHLKFHRHTTYRVYLCMPLVAVPGAWGCCCSMEFSMKHYTPCVLVHATASPLLLHQSRGVQGVDAVLLS